MRKCWSRQPAVRESIYKVSESITALSGEVLDAMQADSFIDFAGSVPGVEFTSTGPGRTKITMRGLSSSEGVSTIGFYIDETPVTSRDSFGNGQPEIKMFDVERVEVLRGPQGTLYGEGSMGGTIRVITNQPDATGFAGALDGTLSSTKNGGTNWGVNAMVNIPLATDQLAVRAVAYIRDNDGWIDDIVSGEKNVNKEESKGARISLKYDPTDKLSIIGRFTHSELDSDFPNITQVDRDTNTGTLSPYADDSDLYSLTVLYDFSFAQLTSNSAYYKRDTEITSNFPPAILSIFEMFGFFPPLAPGTLTGGGLASAGTTKEFTQEVRLVSIGDGPLQWIVGGYYRDGKNPSTFGLFFQPASVLPPDGFLFNTEETIDTEHLAFYGELSYALTDQFELKGGARWFTEETSNATQAADASAVTPKVTLSYQINDNTMTYFTASTGFRSGGLNPDMGDERPLSYDEDTSLNFEIGGKAILLDGRLALAGAAYYIDWKDMQIFTSIPTSPIGFTDNAGKAHTAGVEAEIDYQPADGLHFRFAGSYTEAEFDEAFGDVKEGNSLENVPEFKLSASVDYTFALTDTLSTILRAGVQYVDDSWGSVLNEDFPLGSTLQPSYTLVNLSAVLLGRENWRVTLFVNNATDELAVLRNDTFGGIHEYRPRTIGIRTRFDF